ncbi:hypothetical protein WMO64_00850 [Pseudoflavonifractor sp. CLA-AP-H29]|uniref:Tat pathway signal sequence domain protein n=1 Tax=Pseudoflavonifractor intestinihominis TaxID=3133171 RepID=A0ABV1E3X5_9FIRM
MKHTVRRHQLKTAVVLAAACILLVGTATATYTADVGGIQRTVQLWIHGDQTTATIQIADDGSYRLEYPDENGEIQEQSGGGVAFNPDGSERPLTEEEILEELSMPDVEYQENGSVWVYWCGQSIDITDRFENGVCYVKLENSQDTLYMTVEYGNGYTTSPHRYVIP